MKKRIIVFLLLVSVLMVFGACSADKNQANMATNTDYGEAKGDDSYDRNNTEPEEEDYNNEKDSFNDGLEERKIIYTGYVNVETLEFEKTKNDILKYVEDLGGYIQSSRISGVGKTYDERENLATAEYVFRIPISEFSGFMEEIGRYGNVTGSDQNSQDITTRYYDTESRLKAYEVQEERLLELLAKAENVSDLLEIEKELSQVRYEIESLTTQINRWDNLIDYTTVTVYIREVEKISPEKAENFIEKIGQTVVRSAEAFVSFLENLFIVLIYVLPYLLILIILFFIISIIRKKKGKNILPKKRKKDKSNQKENDSEK